MFVRLQLSCQYPIEYAYYAASDSVVGRKDLCAHCGRERGELDAEAVQRFRTVLSICDACRL